MPLYMLNTTRGAIDDGAKARIAADITRIHCEVTGALPSFVNAFFFEDAAHVPLGDKRVSVFGGIRAGRNDAQKERIATGIRESVARHVGFAVDDVGVTLQDSPASWAMEGGLVMPEPGEEAAWKAAFDAKRDAVAS